MFFTEGVANTKQLIGVGNQENGIFYGYDGDKFGILRRYGGKTQIYQLIIDTASTGAGTIVLTLNGVAVNITVGAIDTVSEVARAIGYTNLLNVGGGWSVSFSGPNIYVMSNSSGLKNGTYSLALGTATGVTGHFVLLQNGLLAIDEWIYSNEWNRDTIDGTGSMPIIDLTRGNVFKISFQWLGFGKMIFEMENPKTGLYEEVHTIKYANKYQTPSLHNPNLPFYAYATNGTTTNNILMKIPSVGIGIEGKINKSLGNIYGSSSILSQSLTADERRNILTIKNNTVFNNQVNTAELLLQYISIGYTGSKASLISFYFNASFDLSADITWENIDINGSIVSKTSDFLLMSGGREVFSISMGTDSTHVLNMIQNEIYIGPGQSLTMEVRSIASVASADLIASVSWIERR